VRTAYLKAQALTTLRRLDPVGKSAEEEMALSRNRHKGESCQDSSGWEMRAALGVRPLLPSWSPFAAYGRRNKDDEFDIDKRYRPAPAQPICAVTGRGCVACNRNVPW
jgi:hypothetical protein